MNEEYDVWELTKELTLTRYVELVKELAQSSEQLQIEKIPRSMNSKVDQLSKAER